MEIIADLVMLLWLPAVVLCFSVLPPSRAVIVAYLFAWLFLPNQDYPLPGLPDYTKTTATTLGVLIGGALNAGSYFQRLQFRVIDVPVIVFCLAPFLSSTLNSLGIYDGISASLSVIASWGLPYLLGRVFLNDARSLREMAIGVFVAGLVYIPLCLFEVRMSPQLHEMVYGQTSFGWEGYRLGGWRPRVFMKTGLMLSFWMAMSALTGIWLYYGGKVKALRNCPTLWLVGLLLITTILCRSTGALALLFLGLGCLWFTRKSLNRIALAGLLAIPPAYLVTRISGAWDGTQITNFVTKLDADRAQSFQFRLDNEDMLVAKAMQSPIFGWGGWGRARIYDEWGKDISITDGLWIIELGNHGLVGLISLYMVLLMPLTLLLWKFPASQLTSPRLAPALVLAICVTLYAIDNLPNGLVNPIFMLMAGGVATCATNGALLLSAAERNGRLTSSETVSSRAIVPRRLHTGGA